MLIRIRYLVFQCVIVKTIRKSQFGPTPGLSQEFYVCFLNLSCRLSLKYLCKSIYRKQGILQVIIKTLSFDKKSSENGYFGHLQYKTYQSFVDYQNFLLKFSKDIFVVIQISVMKVVTAELLLLLVLVIQANSLQMHYQGIAPQLEGSSFQIKKGQLSASVVATFSFNDGILSWKQCNNYFCGFTQIEYAVNIQNCGSTKLWCGDQTEFRLVQKIQRLKSFRVVDADYIFSNGQGIEQITFTKI